MPCYNDCRHGPCFGIVPAAEDPACSRLTLVAAICLASGASARSGGPGRAQGVTPGRTFWYQGKCVTITRVAGQQVSYRYKQVTLRGNATSTVVGSGSVPRAARGAAVRSQQLAAVQTEARRGQPHLHQGPGQA